MKKIYLFYLLVVSFWACSQHEEVLENAKKSLAAGQNEQVVQTLTPILTNKADLHEGFNLRGVAFLNLKQPEKALADFNTAIKLNSNDYKYFYNRGNVYQATQQLNDALKDYEKAIELNPNQADLHTNKGVVLIQMNRHKEALAALNKAISLNPSERNAIFNRGQVHLFLEDYEKAITDLHHTVEISPDFGKGHYILAKAELLKNQQKATPEICSHLAKAKELSYADTDSLMSLCK
jgi:tetratricopeptide (TPR) repeat protein